MFSCRVEKCTLIKCKLHQISIRLHLWWNANINKPLEALLQLWRHRNTRKSFTRRASVSSKGSWYGWPKRPSSASCVHLEKEFCDWKLLYFIWCYHLITWKTSSLPTHLLPYVSELGCVNPREYQSLVSAMTEREQNLPTGWSCSASLCRWFQMINCLQSLYKTYFHMDVRCRDFLRTKVGLRAKWNMELNSWVNKENAGMQQTWWYVLGWLQRTELLDVSLKMEQLSVLWRHRTTVLALKEMQW